MTKPLTKSQIDKLGERLKLGPIYDSDLELLDQYRMTFLDAYGNLFNTIIRLGLNPTGRAVKSTKSIIEKLKREKGRLSNIQDIAGCRLIVKNIDSQNGVVALLQSAFPLTTKVVDRRVTPKNGYRAVHIIVKHQDKLIEIQVRTKLQDYWAEVSERLSDQYGIEIKYGQGARQVLEYLTSFSKGIKTLEDSRQKNLPEVLLPRIVEDFEIFLKKLYEIV
jgi:putative GTP pyrophosphokinase